MVIRQAILTACFGAFFVFGVFTQISFAEPWDTPTQSPTPTQTHEPVIIGNPVVTDSAFYIAVTGEEVADCPDCRNAEAEGVPWKIYDPDTRTHTLECRTNFPNMSCSASGGWSLLDHRPIVVNRQLYAAASSGPPPRDFQVDGYCYVWFECGGCQNGETPSEHPMEHRGCAPVGFGASGSRNR